MNREQQKILELLKEIDTICRKNKITYFLSLFVFGKIVDCGGAN